jgi:uncharacterized protein (TIGR02145 family)
MKKVPKLLLLVSFTAFIASFNSCKKDVENPPVTTPTITTPTITTAAVSMITTLSVETGGNVTSSGGAKVTARGICWSTSPGPTLADSTTTDGTGSGAFASTISGLTPNTTYVVRAYATNSVGTAYGNEISFTTNSVRLATLTTTSATEITVASAVSGGDISDNGDGEITDYGICWATTRNPTTSNNIMTLYGFDNFAGIINGLQPSTKYYVRSYATNGAGTAYGNELNFVTSSITPIIFNPDLTYGSVLDIDGNTYKTIMIGTQVWMAENLRTTKYNDGTSIPYATDNSVINGFSWYNHDAGSYKSTYGGLYTWWAATDSRNLCPTGWHVPTSVEWFIMRTYLGPGDNSVVPDKVKEAGTTHWLSPNTASNGSGFTALPGGIGWGTAGQFTNIGYDGSWWSASSSDPSGLGADIISISSAYSDEPSALKTYGISVRCMKDN